MKCPNDYTTLCMPLHNLYIVMYITGKNSVLKYCHFCVELETPDELFPTGFYEFVSHTMVGAEVGGWVYYLQVGVKGYLHQ